MWDVIERHGSTREIREHRQPDRQRDVARYQREEQQKETDGQRHGGCVHEWMSAAQPPAPVVGQRTGERICERIDDHGSADGQAHPSRREAEHLVVIEHQESAECGVLNAFCGLPDAKSKLGPEGQLVPGERVAIDAHTDSCVLVRLFKTPGAACAAGRG